MTHPQLRLAAAKFTLELANVADLVDATHVALDAAVYADGLAAIVSVSDLQLWDASPHFAAALRELGHAFASQDDAVRHLRLGYFGSVAEEMGDPHAGLWQHYDRLHNLENYGSLATLSGWGEPSAQALTDHLYAHGYLLAEAELETDPLAPGEALFEWNQTAIRLCRDWYREYACLHLQPAWRSPTVVSLATALHAERAFDRLPILADALEEAGCDHPDLLAHLRHNTPHTDYCWLVDAILNEASGSEPTQTRNPTPR